MIFDLSSSFSAVGEGVVIVLVSIAAVGSLLADIVVPVSSKLQIIGAVTLDLLPMGNLGVTAWVGFTLGYDQLPIFGYTLVNYPRP